LASIGSITRRASEKLLAVERLLECRPDLRHRFVFAQIAQPSREALPAYRQTRERVLAAAERINQRFGGGPPPIVLLPVCYVGSLHDGMNLVAKECVAARDDEQGVLVLSAFAGASYELRDALIVNPYDVEQVARSLAAAVDMPALQQRYRMRRLRRVVAAADARSWASRILKDVNNDIANPVKPFVHHPSATSAGVWMH
jgi:trehalose 6-phosphate synthase